MKALPWLLAIAVLILLFFVFMPIGGTSKYAAAKTACLSNMKQLTRALEMYSNSNDGKTPIGDWAKVLPIKDKRILSCPLLAMDKRGDWGYAMNSKMVGIAVNKVKSPEKAVVFFETDALGPSVIANLSARVLRRHGPGSIQAFLDGHARFIRDETQP